MASTNARQQEELVNQLELLCQEERALEQRLNELQKLNAFYDVTSEVSSDDLLAKDDAETGAIRVGSLNSAIAKLDVYNLPAETSGVKIPVAFRNSEEYLKNFHPNFMNEVHGFIETGLRKSNLSVGIHVQYVKETAKLCRFKVLKDTDSVNLRGRSLCLLVPGLHSDLPKSFEAWRKRGIPAYFSINITGIHPITNTFQIFKTPDPQIDYSSIEHFTLVLLEQLSTIEREFDALKRLPKLILANEIVNPCEPCFSPTTKVPQTFINSLSQKFNESQANIIEQMCRFERGIALIEGPPGTGKTETIVGLLSAFLLNTDSPTKMPKILVCGPSNAAVNAIMLRVLRLGLFTETLEQRTDLHMVRVGSIRCKVARFLGKQQEYSDNYMRELKHLLLTTQADIEIANIRASLRTKQAEMECELDLLKNRQARLQEMLKQGCSCDDLQQERTILEASLTSKTAELQMLTCQNPTTKAKRKAISLKEKNIQDMKKFLSALEETGETNPKHISPIIKQLEESMKSLSKQRNKLLTELGKPDREFRMQATRNVLNRSNIVFATLSSSASGELSNKKLTFDYLLIDEACQSSEPSCLIPFQYKVERVVLIGDPRQLPATCFAETASKSHYNRSLFERIQKNNCIPQLLNIQYRMTPEICAYPSEVFYQFQLNTAPEVRHRTVPNWIPRPELQYFNIFSTQEQRDSTTFSVYNPHEAVAAVMLALLLQQRSVGPKDIGIVTPYRRQIQELKAVLAIAKLSDIEVNSVDGFQGREKDFVILSCVRTSRIGFLTEWRRANVALTRAKFGLWILGHSRLLKKDPIWRHLIHHHIERSTLANLEDCFELAQHFQYNATGFLQQVKQRRTNLPHFGFLENSLTPLQPAKRPRSRPSKPKK